MGDTQGKKLVALQDGLELRPKYYFQDKSKEGKAGEAVLGR